MLYNTMHKTVPLISIKLNLVETYEIDMYIAFASI